MMLFAAAWRVSAILTFVLIYRSHKTNGGRRMSIDKTKIRLCVRVLQEQMEKKK